MTKKPIPKGMIPLNQRTKSEQLAIQRKGGMTKTPNRNRAAKLREIKKRIKKGHLHNDDEEWLLARIESKELMDIDMLNWLNKLRKESPDENFDGRLLSLYSQLARQMHPPATRVDVNVKTLNLNEPIPPEMLKLLTEDFEQ